MMNILTLSHAYVEPANRRMWERLVELYPDICVTIVVPTHWQTNRYGPTVTYTVQPEQRERYEVQPLHLAGGHFQRYAGLAAVLHSRKPDIVCIAQERFNWSTLFALLVARWKQPSAKRITFTLTNIDYHLRYPHHVIKERLFFSLSDAILASDSEAELLLRTHGYRGRSTVQYPLAAVDPPTQVAERSDSLLEVGYVGTLASEKGVMDLLEAIARLDGKWRLHFIGDGPERLALQAKTAELNIGERVVFCGYVSRDAIMAHLAELHVVVLPSHTTPNWKEQFGVVLVEAMLAGAVVIGSDSGAIPEVIGDAGLVFPEGNIAALAVHLQHLHDNPAFRTDLAIRGRQRAKEHYASSALAHDFYTFAHNLLKNRPCAL